MYSKFKQIYLHILSWSLWPFTNLWYREMLWKMHPLGSMKLSFYCWSPQYHMAKPRYNQLLSVYVKQLHVCCIFAQWCTSWFFHPQSDAVFRISICRKANFVRLQAMGSIHSVCIALVSKYKVQGQARAQGILSVLKHIDKNLKMALYFHCFTWYT